MRLPARMCIAYSKETIWRADAPPATQRLVDHRGARRTASRWLMVPRLFQISRLPMIGRSSSGTYARKVHRPPRQNSLWGLLISSPTVAGDCSKWRFKPLILPIVLGFQWVVMVLRERIEFKNERDKALKTMEEKF